MAVQDKRAIQIGVRCSHHRQRLLRPCRPKTPAEVRQAARLGDERLPLDRGTHPTQQEPARTPQRPAGHHALSQPAVGTAATAAPFNRQAGRSGRRTKRQGAQVPAQVPASTLPIPGEVPRRRKGIESCGCACAPRPSSAGSTSRSCAHVMAAQSGVGPPGRATPRTCRTSSRERRRAVRRQCHKQADQRPPRCFPRPAVAQRQAQRVPERGPGVLRVGAQLSTSRRASNHIASAAVSDTT